MKVQLYRWLKKYIMRKIPKLSKVELIQKHSTLSKNIFKQLIFKYLSKDLFKRLCNNMKLSGELKMLIKFLMILPIRLQIYLGASMLIYAN